MRDRQQCSQQLQYHAVYLSRPVQVLGYTCIGVPVVFAVIWLSIVCWSALAPMSVAAAACCSMPNNHINQTVSSLSFDVSGRFVGSI